jgi:ubiquinone biosynthesis protein
LITGTRIAAKYHIHIPGEWMVVFKAIFTMEGLGRQLDPEFDLMTVGNELVKDLVKDRYSMQRLTKDLSFVARDLSVLVQTAPRQIRMMFRKFNSNDFAVEVKFREMEVLRRQMECGFRGIGMSLLSSAALIGGAITVQMPEGPKVWGHYPLVAVLLFGISGLGFLRLVFRRWR